MGLLMLVQHIFNIFYVPIVHTFNGKQTVSVVQMGFKGKIYKKLLQETLQEHTILTVW